MDDESAGNLRRCCQNLSKRKRMLLSRERTNEKLFGAVQQGTVPRRLAGSGGPSGEAEGNCAR
jgi:hypothetical protein